MNPARKGVVLFIIDPQHDFLGNWDGSPYTAIRKEGTVLSPVEAALPVKGAVDALERLTTYVDSDANGEGIDDIVVTLDTHEEGAREDSDKNPDIGHPAYWRDKDGNRPTPMMTIISLADVESGKWQPYNLLLLNYVLDYLRKVGIQVVWNRHCIDGTWGHQVYGPLATALAGWERRTGKSVCYVRKGMNPNTEQYGVFEAAVPDSKDPRTRFNWTLLDRLRNNSRPKKVGGIATDFCVKTSMEQAVAKLSCGEAKEFSLLIDAMADVNLDGTGAAAMNFIDDMRRKGVSVETCYKAAA